MEETGRTGSTIRKWASRSAQDLFLTVVLLQNSLAMPTALDDKSPIIEPSGGRGDEAIAATAMTTSGRGLPRRLRREGHPSSRGSHQRHQQQLWAEQKRISPMPSRDQQESGQQHRKLEGTTEEDPDVSFATDILEDDNSSAPQVYHAPADGSCPVAAHDPNSAVLSDDGNYAAEPPTVIVGTFSVWSRLQQALDESSRLRCPSPPCCLGVHTHTYREGDLGEEMSHVQGAVVVRRPDLAQAPGSVAPAQDVDFVKTLQSYFPISQSSLLRRIVEADGFNLTSTTQHVEPAFAELLVATDFFGAVREGNPAAAELLTPYCSGEDPRQDISDCVRIPTLVSMADVYISYKGAVWNENDFIMPVNCDIPRRHEADDAREQAREGLQAEDESYEKVFVMTQEWNPNYYHFTVEHLPRITLMLDVLLENPDIMIAMHYSQHDKLHQGGFSNEIETHMEMFEILGISRDRVVLAMKQMHAELAIVPTSTICGDPDAHMVNMLRNRFLQGLFPTTNGVPPAQARPVIVLVVRTTLRGLRNNDKVKEALEMNFPSFDVVEFFGTDPVRDQLMTFANASMVIAPHGAGLANMIVAPLHTPVLEIAPLSCPSCFLRLALKLHHIYARHPGGEWSQECHTWYEPDIDEMIDLVRDLLEAKRQADDALELPEATDMHQEQP
ncbi:unnamed protein product [Ectocarpus sp. 6 AP-2014]